MRNLHVKVKSLYHCLLELIQSDLFFLLGYNRSWIDTNLSLFIGLQQVYVAELLVELGVCIHRDIHNRGEGDIRKVSGALKSLQCPWNLKSD